jgi:hypothetical protein
MTARFASHDLALRASMIARCARMTNGPLSFVIELRSSEVISSSAGD